MLVQFLNNCCCVDLRVGSFIVGYMKLVLELLLLIGIVIIMVVNELEYVFIWVILIIAVLFQVVAVSFNILLLLGLHKDKRSFVKVYLIFTGILMVLSVIYFTFAFAGLAQRHLPGLTDFSDSFQTKETADISYMGLSNLIICCAFGYVIPVYFYAVILSQYYKMLETRHGDIHNRA